MHRKMRSKSGLFDTCPVPQHRSTNKILHAINLFGLLFFGAVATCIFIFVPLKMPLKFLIALPPLFLALLGLLGFCEGRVESIRISKVAQAIAGKRRGKEQHIETVFADEQVWFSVAKRPMSINYAVRVDGQKALSSAAQLRQHLARRLSDAGLKGYRVLITEDALILSKYFMFVFQIKPDKVTTILDILVRAKRDIIDRVRADSELFPILED